MAEWQHKKEKKENHAECPFSWCSVTVKQSELYNATADDNSAA